MLTVKICGLTTLEDALAAVEAGADLLGFNFYPPSPRYISPAECARLAAELRKRGCSARLVGVFVNASAGEIEAILDGCALDLAQLSGDEGPELVQRLGKRAFKAIRPAGPSEPDYPARAEPPAYLIDAYRPGEYGGTGQTGDWRLAAELARRAPILLAGGLRSENVAAAVQQVHPWGVDVASGVESAPGRKDPDKMRAFIQSAREAEHGREPSSPANGGG